METHTLAVYKTDDLSIFRNLSGNRALNKQHVKKLAKSILANQKLTTLEPIKVNEFMEVIDGQHRLAACKELVDRGIQTPIYFIKHEGLNIEHARALNSGSKPWSPKDYAEAYARDKMEDYKIYLRFISMYGLNHDITARLLAGLNGYSMTAFREGAFRVEEVESSHRIVKQLSDMAEFYEQYRHRGFALAFIEIASSKNYDHERMKDQMTKYSHLLATVPLLNKEMERKLRIIYNRGNEKKI